MIIGNSTNAVTFSGNTASGNGGAINAKGNTSLSISYDTFSGNTAVNGGALYLKSAVNDDQSATILLPATWPAATAVRSMLPVKH